MLNQQGTEEEVGGLWEHTLAHKEQLKVKCEVSTIKPQHSPGNLASPSSPPRLR